MEQCAPSSSKTTEVQVGMSDSPCRSFIAGCVLHIISIDFFHEYRGFRQIRIDFQILGSLHLSRRVVGLAAEFNATCYTFTADCEG